MAAMVKTARVTTRKAAPSAQATAKPQPSGAIANGPQPAGKSARKRSKTGLSECSQAASEWQKAIKSGQKAPSAVYLKLAQCRAATRVSKAASLKARSGKITDHAAAGVAARQEKRVANNLATDSARKARLKDLLQKRNARPISDHDKAHAAATAAKVTGQSNTGPSGSLSRLRASKQPTAKPAPKAKPDKQALKKLKERNKPVEPLKPATTAPADKAAALVARVRGSAMYNTNRIKARENRDVAAASVTYKQAFGQLPAPHSSVKATKPAPEPATSPIKRRLKDRKRFVGPKAPKPAPAPAQPAKPGYSETKKSIARIRLKEKARAEQTSGVQTLKTGDIKADPSRFQYKLNTAGPVGVTDQFKGTENWNKELAGVIQVWKDPSNSQTYVVNGHHRFELAQRLGVQKLNVQYIKAKTDVEARMKGALTNIAEGRGTSVDAAKFFRDQPHVKDWNAELKGRGISLKEKTAAEGLALKDLAPPIWRDVVNEVTPVSRGVAIGKAGLRHEDQVGLYRKAQTGNWSAGKTSEFATEVKNSSLVKVKTGGLFGDDEELNVYEHRAALADRFKTRESTVHKLFSKVARGRNANQIESVGNNKIDVQASAERATQADNALMVFERERKYSGVVSKILNHHAERIAKGEKLDKVYPQFEKQMAQALRMTNQGKFERRDQRLKAAKEAANKPKPIVRRLKDRKRSVATKAPAPAKFSRNGELAPGRGTDFRKSRAAYLIEDRKNSQNARKAFAEATREKELPWMVDGVEITGDPNHRPQISMPVARFTSQRNQKADELRQKRFERLGKGYELKKQAPKGSKKKRSATTGQTSTAARLRAKRTA